MHGPHQVALKSTMTGSLLSRTLAEKSSSSWMMNVSILAEETRIVRLKERGKIMRLWIPEPHRRRRPTADVSRDISCKQNAPVFQTFAARVTVSRRVSSSVSTLKEVAHQVTTSLKDNLTPSVSRISKTTISLQYFTTTLPFPKSFYDLVRQPGANILGQRP